MPASVTLIRHAETKANVARLWQGQTDTSFSPRGEAQLAALGRRLQGANYDIVVASDLPRTVGTAEATGLPFTTDKRWREIDVGEWEGLTYAEIREKDPERWQAFLDGRDVPLGGGESVGDVRNRITAVHRELVEQIGPDGRALVITHGLATVMAFHGALDITTAMSIRVPANTSMSTIQSTDVDTHMMMSYNDTTHLDDLEPPGHVGETRVVLVRHGETEANLTGRWQGHQDSPLTPAGEDQAMRLGARPPHVDVVYSSPAGRARSTAEAMVNGTDHTITSHDGLMEMGFGEWEGSTVEQIRSRDREVFDNWRLNGMDIPRGHTGETFAGVRERMTAAIEGFVETHTGDRIGVVSHGGATRAYISGVLGLDFPRVRSTIHGLGNTGIAHVGYDTRGPALIAWNIAPHLG
jgi:probable phosphoglycerate mutase